MGRNMKSLESLAEDLAAGKVTSRALIESSLETIETGSEGSRAFITVHAEQARAVADADRYDAGTRGVRSAPSRASRCR